MSQSLYLITLSYDRHYELFVTLHQQRIVNGYIHMMRNKKITPEYRSRIKKTFISKIKSIEDLLKLINVINVQRFGKSEDILMKQLTYQAFINTSKYTKFEIPKKKSVTPRIIYAPKKNLKNILTTINIILQSIYKPLISTHGFVNYRSVVTNAKHHTNKTMFTT